MIDNEIRKTLIKRISLHPEDSFAAEKCWDEEMRVLCRDIEDTIDFMSNRCTGEEYVWLSEVFEEVQEKLQSPKFNECLKALTKKYPKETEEYNIREFIEGLEGTER